MCEQGTRKGSEDPPVNGEQEKDGKHLCERGRRQ